MKTNKQTQLLLRFLKESKFIYKANVYKQLKTHNNAYFYAFLDREFRDWASLDGGWTPWYKSQVLLAFISWMAFPRQHSIKSYLCDLLEYIVTEEDILIMGEEDDEDSKKIRESEWYQKICNRIKL